MCEGIADTGAVLGAALYLPMAVGAGPPPYVPAHRVQLAAILLQQNPRDFSLPNVLQRFSESQFVYG